jgi:leader peptidase (prepilin peptidase)/N-methyltransferase
MVFIFEVINLIYKRLRGSDGMGMGDTMIILGTIGVPTAISGAWQMGYRITMLSFLLGIVGWLYNKVKNNATKEEPFAFGPYLAVGWMLAVVTWQLTNGVLPTGF